MDPIPALISALATSAAAGLGLVALSCLPIRRARPKDTTMVRTAADVIAAKLASDTRVTTANAALQAAQVESASSLSAQQASNAALDALLKDHPRISQADGTLWELGPDGHAVASKPELDSSIVLPDPEPAPAPSPSPAPAPGA